MTRARVRSGRRLAAVTMVAGLLALGRSGHAGQPMAPQHVVECGALFALPAALRPGLSTGVDASYVRRWRWLAWGGRLSWSTATEHSSDWAVRHDELRLRLLGVLQRQLGRGTVGLRLGLGATLVRELRARHQGARARLTGDALEASAWALLPAADLEGLVALRVWGPLGLMLSGGPSLHIQGGSARVGWLGGLGVTWQR